MVSIALIPARLNATRFPSKLMADLKGKSVIRRTYEATLATSLFNDVYVVCDSPVIYNEIVNNGGKAILSKKEHECGTDRIAEAAAEMEADIIVNVQGDEPFVKKQPLADLLEVFKKDAQKEIHVGSLMQVLKSQKEIDDPNYVKVAVDKDFNALFFSRSVIPYPRNPEHKAPYYEHIGVYAFRKEALIKFIQLPVGILEDAEKVECLRFLENGMKMKMVMTEYMGIEIDIPEDIEKAKKFL
jgi:3-deoxy-manno-octulosonate cytidylyltransferase (CMP-KDO synthetase)